MSADTRAAARIRLIMIASALGNFQSSSFFDIGINRKENNNEIARGMSIGLPTTRNAIISANSNNFIVRLKTYDFCSSICFISFFPAFPTLSVSHYL